MRFEHTSRDLVSLFASNTLLYCFVTSHAEQRSVTCWSAVCASVLQYTLHITEIWKLLKTFELNCVQKSFKRARQGSKKPTSACLLGQVYFTLEQVTLLHEQEPAGKPSTD